MAEFAEVIKQYKRLLAVHNRGEETPIDIHYPCMMERTEHFEETVMSWAAEHPEPVYPTWGEWLKEQGFVTRKTVEYVDYRPGVISHKNEDVDVLTDKAYDHIPADIAENLGIEPKEET